MNENNIDTLVSEFADCVAAQQTAVAQGDADRGNEFAKRYINAFEQLKANGNAGRDALTNLFGDARPAVRVMAAAYLLRHREREARAILVAESMGKGLIAFSAKQALKRWEEGTWDLDPTE